MHGHRVEFKDHGGRVHALEGRPQGGSRAHAHDGRVHRAPAANEQGGSGAQGERDYGGGCFFVCVCFLCFLLRSIYLCLCVVSCVPR